MMKIFNKIMTLILVVAMISSFSTVAFALSDEAGYYTFKADIVEESVKVGDTVTVKVLLSSKDGEDVEFLTEPDYDSDGCSVMLGFEYDSTILELTGSQNATGFSAVPGDTLADGKRIQIFTFANDITMKSGDAFVTHTFKVKDGVADGTYADAVKIVSSNCALSDGYLIFNLWTEPAVPNGEADALVVKAAGGDDDENDDPVDVTEPVAGTKITVNEGTLADKQVVIAKYTAINDQITENTKVQVTYAPSGATPKVVTYGSTLFDDLKFQGNGSVTAGTIVFGVVCDTNLDANAFSFALVQ